MNVKAVIAIIDEFNAEYNLLKEVMTKSISEKINEVREEERQKAALEKEEALKKLALEHQAALKQAEDRLAAKDTMR